MENLSFLSVLILFGFVQGLILVAAINRIKDRNIESNRILSALILLISLVLLSRLVYGKGVTIWMAWPHLFLLPDITMFLYGPLFYLYIKSLLLENKSKISENWFHFIPFGLHLILLSYYLFESKEKYLNRLMTGDLWEVPYAEYASLLHIAIYLGLSFFIFKTHKKQISSNLQTKYPLDYLRHFFILVSICWVTWLYSSLASNFTFLPRFTFFSYNLSWVALSLVTFLLAYYSMSQQEIFKIKLVEKKYEGSTLSKEKLDHLEQQLKKLMQNSKPFLDKALTRQQLASQMQIHPKDLSRLINERHGMNFFDYVNSFRVTEFQSLCRNNEYQHLSLLGIAFEAGFNSKTTFNTAFKKFTGTTPNQFLKEIDD